MLKIIDKMVIKDFIGPYVVSFFIAEFVLIMQFLWKYIDEILGKGFSVLDICELILYYGMSIVPLALPISILISSVMVFGDLAEKHALPSFKSAGVSLIRIMRGGIIIALLTFVYSIFASNYLKPAATFQFKKRFDLIRKQKSSLTIEEKIFNDDFSNFIIRVNEKSKDGVEMKDVLIYDHSKPDKSLVNIISSDSARMYSTNEGKYFVMDLYDGVQYQEDERERKDDGGTKYPFTKTEFESFTKVMDMSEFQIDADNFSFSGRRQDMMNSLQLIEALDSLNNHETEVVQNLTYSFNDLTTSLSKPEPNDYRMIEEYHSPQRDTTELDTTVVDSVDSKSRMSKTKNKGITVNIIPVSLDSVTHFYELIDDSDRARVLSRAVSIANARADISWSTDSQLYTIDRFRNDYWINLNQHYSFATVCLIFFFIGAPLGSIIRKGGYGYSLLVAITFYMVFIISEIMGRKLVRNETLNGIEGAWIPCLILFPFAVIFTIQALNDVKFDLGSKILAIFKRNKEESEATPNTTT